MSFAAILSLSLGLILAENVIFTRCFGIRPLLGGSARIRPALAVSVCVALAISVASILSWLVTEYLLTPYGLAAARTPVFVLIIALIEVVLEFTLSRFTPNLRALLGAELPTAAASSAVLGSALILSTASTSALEALIGGVSAGAGFVLAAMIFCSVRRRIRFSDAPASFEGIPLALVSAALVALAFAGFSGISF